MCESMNVEGKKEGDQKAPRSFGRIVCEILGGVAAGLAVAAPVAYVIDARLGQVGQAGTFGGLTRLICLLLVVPPVYGFCSGVGVYLVATRGKQTGLLSLTLVGGLGGGIIMYVVVPVSGILTVGVERIVSYVLFAFMVLIPPILATIGFNSSRKYK